MIRGIGLDVVNVSRIRKWLGQTKLIERFFHPREIETFLLKGNRAALHLAARFAAKEAFGKALGTGLKDFSLRELYILNDKNGRPVLYFEPKAYQEFLKKGGGKVFLSLTHEHDYALAMVVIEEEL